MQLALGQEGVNEVQTTEIPYVNSSHVGGFEHPLVLRIAITVLISSECMRHALDRINNGTGKVVGRVDFPFVTNSEMRELGQK